jgi:hypothetical protein
LPPAKYDALVNDSEPEAMSQIQIIGFFVAPLAVDWRARHE